MDALKEKGLSERRACFLAGITVEGYKYKCKESELNKKLRRLLKKLAGKYKRWGFPTLFTYVKKLGYAINEKRLHRLYKEEGLQLSRRKRRKKGSTERRPATVPDKPNRRWSMDFIFDATADQRKLKNLIIVDDYTRESLTIYSDRSIPGWKVCEVLEILILIHGKPEAILTDNGPEFTSKAYCLWMLENNIRAEYIQPGRPMQNPFAESFNSIFREQCLNENWFLDLEDAREQIEAWRIEYNSIRPHGSLGGKTPEEFKADYAENLHSN